MTTLHQLPLSYFENMPETYVPTESDRERGNWAIVFQSLDENGEPDITSDCHIVPIRGLHHQLTKACWCGPSSEPMNNGKEYINHRMSQ